MDYFEKHIRDNKALFDEHKADRAKMWAKIESELSNTKPKVVPLWKSPLFRVAASVVLVLLLTSLIGITVYGGYQSDGQNSVVSQELLDIDIGNYKKRIELIENLLRQINDSKMINDDYGYTL